MKIEITAFPRTVQGTGASRRLRGGGKVPGIVYGVGTPTNIELDHNALFHALNVCLVFLWLARLTGVASCCWARPSLSGPVSRPGCGARRWCR